MKQICMLLCLCVAALVAKPVAMATEARCPPVEMKALQERLNQAQEQIQLVDYAAALSALEKAEVLLPCIAEIVPAQQLARLYVYRGLTMFYLGNADLARVSFLRSLAIDRELKWDPKLGSRARETFLDAREESLSRPSQALRCPMLAPGVQVYLNGRELSQGQMTSLPPGIHFLQIRWSDGHWEGSLFELTAGREIPLPVPRQALLVEIPLATPAPANGSTQPETSGAASTPVASAPPTRTAPPDAVKRPSYAPGFVALGIAAVGLAGTGYFGSQYLSTKQALESGNYFSDVDDPAKDALLATNAQAATRSTISIAVTVVASGSSALLFRRARHVEKAPGVATLWLPWVTPKGAGLLLHREF